MLNQEQKNKMLNLFKSQGELSLTLTHYELHTYFPQYTAQEWKEFLCDTDIYEWMQSELDIIRSAELNKVLKNINDTNSVGKAQIVNALTKLTENKTNKNQNGPIFIYSYVPLNEQQEQATNVQLLNTDPFNK